MLIYNLYITLTFILRKKNKKRKKGEMEGRKEKGREERKENKWTKVPKMLLLWYENAPHSDSQYPPSVWVCFPLFSLSPLGTFGFCSQSWFLYHPGCFRPSSFHVLLPCLPLYSFAFTCFQLHITHTKGRKSHSKANEILQLNILYNVTNHVI